MPNWCSNHVSIMGNPEQLTAFILAASSNNSDLSLESLFPCPQSLRDAPAGSDEVYYDIVHGELSKFAGYSWIPAEIKNDRDALMSFLTNRSGITIEKGREIADLIKHNLETYGVSNWYDWCVKNWGTKWDIEGEGSRLADDHASYTFQSAWSPPVEAFVTISKSFPELTFDLEYFESGMSFMGRVEIRDGESNSCHDKWDSEEQLQEIVDSGVYDFASGEAEVYLEAVREWNGE